MSAKLPALRLRFHRAWALAVWCACSALPAASHAAPQSGAPPQRYSYFSPGNGTVNLEDRRLDPSAIKAVGKPLPSDAIVLTGQSQTLLRLRPDGKIVWSMKLGGGGSYGLSQFRGQIALAFDRDLLLIDPNDGRVRARLPLLGESQAPLQFIRVQGDVVIGGDGTEQSNLVLASLTEAANGQVSIGPVEKIQSRIQYPRDAFFLDPEHLAVADTFGHAVVILKRQAKWREIRRLHEYFPNMVEGDMGQVTVLSEHGNRISTIELGRNSRTTVLACPERLFYDPYTTPQQIVSEEPRTVAGGGSLPLQRCSATVSGPQTLYAANGFYRVGPRDFWVADADNHRIALFYDGRYWGAIAGINHPVRVIPVDHL